MGLEKAEFQGPALGREAFCRKAPFESFFLGGEKKETFNVERHCAMKRPSETGITLVELLIVAAVVVVMGSIGVPQLRQSMAAYRLTASTNLVSAELSAAREMSMTRANIHQLAIINESTIVIIDPNDPSPIPNAPRPQAQLDSGVIIRGPYPTIRFFARGLAQGGTVILENEFGDQRRVAVSDGGEIMIQ